MKKKSITVNINDMASVKLTDYGLIRLGYDANGPHHYNYDTKILKIELWDLMKIFSDAMYMGCPQLFEKNEITITHD